MAGDCLYPNHPFPPLGPQDPLTPRPPLVLRCIDIIGIKAAPTLARRDKSHALDPGIDSHNATLPTPARPHCPTFVARTEDTQLHRSHAQIHHQCPFVSEIQYGCRRVVCGILWHRGMGNGAGGLRGARHGLAADQGTMARGLCLTTIARGECGCGVEGGAACELRSVGNRVGFSPCMDCPAEYIKFGPTQ